MSFKNSIKDIIITKISALEVLDSRGNPTVEVKVALSDGTEARAISPSGASTGEKEAVELRDGDHRYKGKGVLKAVANIEEKIAPVLEGLSPFDQEEMDKLMIRLDGSPNKQKLGANAILAVSLAIAKASAKALDLPLYRYIGGVYSQKLPVPMMNIINGGEHADNDLDIQEFMIMPIGAESFSDALRIGSEIFHTLKSLLKKNGHSVNVGDEGGFAPNFNKSREALDYIIKAIQVAGYKEGTDVVIALDCASSEFFKDGKYHVEGQEKNHDDMIAYYEDLIKDYPIFSIEDPLDENDLEGFKKMTAKLGNKIQIVGDDLFCTNPIILQEGIKNKMANALLVKPNQIGTLTETLEAIEMAQRAGYNCVISHRSGESEDVTISHIAIATNAGQIKTGSLCRTDRIAKYNELLRIEADLFPFGHYSGDDIKKD